MQNQKRPSPRWQIPFILLLAFHIAHAHAADFDGNRDNWGDGKDHIVLIKVNGATRENIPNNSMKQMTYTMEVLFDVDGTLKGKTITVTGTVGNFHEDWDAPSLAKGDICLLHLKSTPTSDKFDCQSFMTLPIGIDTSLVIPPPQLPQVQVALTELKNNYPPKPADAQKTIDAALHSKNYYLWSLGASMLAIQQTKETSKNLHNLVYTDVTKDQFLWLNYLFDNVLQVGEPTPQERVNDYRMFLNRGTTYPLH